MLLVDSHAHLDIKDFDDDREEVLTRAAVEGVKIIVNAAFDLASSRRALALAQKHKGIYALAGVHPHDAGKVSDNYLKELAQIAESPLVVALGEIGLDYYRDISPRPVQQRVFREQLSLARELDIPIVIHDREAHGDILSIMKQDGIPKKGGVMHCYSGSWEMAKVCMKMGFYISIAGPVTYNNSSKLKEVAEKIPLDRLLTETDCPYLTPQAHRGTRNEPAYVKYVLEEIAFLRKMEVGALAQAVYANTIEIFSIEVKEQVTNR
jgi:TatD DNase family protein